MRPTIWKRVRRNTRRRKRARGRTMQRHGVRSLALRPSSQNGIGKQVGHSQINRNTLRRRLEREARPKSSWIVVVGRVVSLVGREAHRRGCRVVIWIGRCWSICKGVAKLDRGKYRRSRLTSYCRVNRFTADESLVK